MVTLEAFHRTLVRSSSGCQGDGTYGADELVALFGTTCCFAYVPAARQNVPLAEFTALRRASGVR
jgi:hypothetical protein